MRRISIFIASVAALAVAVPALAGTPPPPNFGGSFDSQSAMGFLAIERNGRMVKVKHFFWDGYKCQGDRFTGGVHNAIKVKSDRTFHSKQKVLGVDAKATIKGQFTKNLQKANGTLKVSGCQKRKWNASQNAE